MRTFEPPQISGILLKIEGIFDQVSKVLIGKLYEMPFARLLEHV